MANRCDQVRLGVTRGDNWERMEVQAASLANKASASSSRKRAEPTPRGNLREASGSQDLNVSRESLIERAENLNLCQLPDVELNEGDVEAKINQLEREKVTQQREAQEQRKQASKSIRSPGEKYFFSPDDRRIIKNTFLFALDSDGNRKATITSYSGLIRNQRSDFHRAYDGNQEFREMVDRIMEDEGFDMNEMKTKIMNIYRALHRD